MHATNVTNGLLDHEELMLIGLLKKVGQPWSEDFYNALAPLMVAVTIEVVCLKRTPEGPEVLLIPRPKTDKHYPGQLHSPGTLLRVSDDDAGGAIQRVFDRELGGVRLQVKRVLHDIVMVRTPRGVEVPNIYIAEVSDKMAARLCEIPGAGFYPVISLPADMILHHRPIVRVAAEAKW